MSKQDATLNLASLLKQDPEAGGEVEGDGLLMPSETILEADGLRLEEPLAWHLSVRSTGGDDDYLLIGDVSGTAVQECRRCLTDVATTLRTSLIYPMAYKAGSGNLTLKESEDDEDTLVFGQPEVDFAPLLAQVFAIDLPLTVLCKETCKGLSLDGVNLNDHPEHEAPVKAQQPESPFSVLKDLDLNN